MNNQLEVRQDQGVAIIDGKGNLTMGREREAIREKMWQVVESGHLKVLLNLAEVTHLDSSTVGELVAAYTTVISMGGELKLLHVRKRVHDILVITRLYTVFEIFDDETAAVRSFANPWSQCLYEDRYSEVFIG